MESLPIQNLLVGSLQVKKRSWKVFIYILSFRIISLQIALFYGGKQMVQNQNINKEIALKLLELLVEKKKLDKVNFKRISKKYQTVKKEVAYDE